jgi:DHA2 family multidrug resistance protein-like MFS transporter
MDATTVHRRRWWTLLVLWLSLLLIGLDATILNVALPTLSRTLGATTGELQWIMDAYILAFAGLLLTAGSLGDRFGRKLILAVGLGVFGASSVVAAYATSPAMLVAARAFMGLGAAAIMPLTLSILPHVFPREERSKAIAIWTAGSGLGLVLGPVFGGLLLKRFWWGSVFLVNVPVVLVALAAGYFLIPESKDPSQSRTDPLGVLRSTAGLATLVYGIIEAPTRGWTSSATLAFLGIGVLAVTAFLVWEARARRSMLDLKLFGNRAFASSSTVLALASFALFGMLFFIPQYLQFVLGASALGAGMRLLPLVAAMAVGAPLSGPLASRFGTRFVVGCGILLVSGALVLFSRTQVESGYAFAVVCMVSLGFGLGAAMAPAIDAFMGSLPTNRTGMGSGLNNTMRQMGGALGVAILGSVLATTYASRIGEATQSLPARAAIASRESIGAAAEVASGVGGTAGRALLEAARLGFVAGMDHASLLAAGVALVGAAVAFTFLPAEKSEAATSHKGDTVEKAHKEKVPT